MRCLFRNSLFLTLFVIVGVLLNGCNDNSLKEEDAREYIEGWTSKYFGGDNGRFMVAFCEPVLKDIGSVDGLMSVKPQVGGILAKKDDYTLMFVPDSGAVVFGERYECVVRLGELYKKELKDFVFEVEAIAPRSGLKLKSLRVDPTDDDAVVINGELLMSCIVNADRIKSEMFEYNGKKLSNVNVTEGQRGGVYNFSVSGVKKSSDNANGKLEFDGAAFGIKEKAELEVNIPKKGEFCAIGAMEELNGEDMSVTVYFSERLDGVQNVDGLVYLPHSWREEPAEAKTEKLDDYVKLSLKSWQCNRNGKVYVAKGIRSAKGKTIDAEKELTYEANNDKPSVQILDNGLVWADVENVKLSFSATNVFAVDVDIVKVYSNNVLGFLRDDSEYSETVHRYGRIVYHRTVRLDEDENFNISKTNYYTIDLKDFVAEDPGAVYKVHLTFKKEYTVYSAGADSRAVELKTTDKVSEIAEDAFDRAGYMDMSDALGYKYWSNTDNPEEDDYYTWGRCNSEHTYIVSNLGVTAKRADDKKVWVSVADIRDVEPVKGAKVELYNYQLQKIGEGETNSDGLCEVEGKNKPFYVVVEKSGRRSYVRVSNGSELSYSRFDVAGEERQKGVKAYVYGERNVWRPGDTLHLSVMVEDTENKLPENCPVTAEMFTPQGQYYTRRVSRNGKDGLYTFNIVTADDCQTGLWRVVFEIGGRKFTEYVRIATIKPNRIKINIDSKSEMISLNGETEMSLRANWLTGSVASGLEYKVEADITTIKNPFEKYGAYNFVNPIWETEKVTVGMSEGELNGVGYAAFLPTDMKEFQNCFSSYDRPACMLNATVIARVFEKGGDVSIVAKDYKCSPYEKYVGIALGDRNFETDKDLKFDIVVLDKNGKKTDSKLKYSIYKMEWNWWEEYTSYNLRQFTSESSKKCVAQGNIETRGGMGSVPFRIDYPSWGRYFIYVEDTGGHGTGGVVTIDWPSYRGMSNKEDASAATMLMFSMDKDVYQVGEEASVYIPAGKGAKALVSVECGGKVMKQEWVDAADDMKVYKVMMTRDMSPNCYIAMSMIWPHSVTVDGLPIRKYGVLPVKVENKESRLEPQIDVPDNIWPQKPFSIKVKEKNNRRMTYTLAIVDEGLLDITSFKTPDPWTAMNKKEALGLRTYDMYADIIGAKSSYFASILSVGGDLALSKASQKEKRFKPVVKFVGPFTLEKGEMEHKMQLPMYVGSVRVMVVACNGERAYGNAEKNVTVSSPLMVLASLPRVLSNGEKVKLPVNVFSTVKGGQTANVTVEVDGPLSIVGAKSKSVSFSAEGDKIVEFELQTDAVREGMAHVRIKASSSVMTTNEEIAIEVRNPQPYIVDSKFMLINGSKRFEWTPFEATDKNKASVTISGMPNIDVLAVYGMMTEYPYRCSEQVSSRLLFMLNAERFLDDTRKAKARETVESMLTTLYERQLPSGGFCYWPGSVKVNEWVTNMAGHALVAAKDKGYNVPDDVLKRWKSFQSGRAKAYYIGKYNEKVTQAYRLYTLALAHEADEAAMNKLKESAVKSEVASALLSSAYSVVGKKNVAKDILSKLEDEAPADVYRWNEEWTFGSHIRDKALLLEALALSGDKERALVLAQNLATTFETRYATTSEAAYAMIAMNRLSNIVSPRIGNVEVKCGDLKKTVKDAERETIEIGCDKGLCEINNLDSDSPVYATLCLGRMPKTTEQVAAANNSIEVKVVYADRNGKEKQEWKQGEELEARITVRNAEQGADVRMMALRFGWPSGMEAWSDIAADERCAYVDQRDDKKIWHFELRRNETQTFVMRLRAAYAGEYICPAVVCEDMYDAAINGRSASGRIVIK